MEAWRLIVHGAADGATNMAIDDALLATAGTIGRPTLRLYAWHPPCLSLGYFQPLADVDRNACAARRITLVRRPTGGRAVLHAAEVTYAAAGSLAQAPFRGAVLEVYHALAGAIAEGLRALGIAAEGVPPKRANGRSGPACFDTIGAHEIAVAGRKLVGSAQTRRAGAVLQHGAIALDGDPAAIAELLSVPAALRPALRSRLARRCTTLGSLLSDQPQWETVAQAIAAGFGRRFGVQLALEDLTAEERARAEDVRATRYSQPAWLARR